MGTREQSGKPVFHGAAKSQTRFDRISLIEQDINWLSAIDYTWPPGLDFRLIELGKETSYSSLRLTSNNEENISKSILKQSIDNQMEFVIYLKRLRWSGLLAIHESAWNLLRSIINRCIVHEGTFRTVGEILLIFHSFHRCCDTTILWITWFSILTPSEVLKFFLNLQILDPLAITVI